MDRLKNLKKLPIKTTSKDELDLVRRIIKKAIDIEKELKEDGQTFCKSSYLMGALAMNAGEFDN